MMEGGHPRPYKFIGTRNLHQKALENSLGIEFPVGASPLPTTPSKWLLALAFDHEA